MLICQSAKNAKSTKFDFSIKSTMLKLKTNIVNNYISESLNEDLNSSNIQKESHLEENEGN